MRCRFADDGYIKEKGEHEARPFSCVTFTLTLKEEGESLDSHKYCECRGSYIVGWIYFFLHICSMILILLPISKYAYAKASNNRGHIPRAGFQYGG